MKNTHNGIPLPKSIKKKVRFEIWFLLVLLLVAITAFAAATLFFGSFFGKPSATIKPPDFSVQEKTLYSKDVSSKIAFDFDALIGRLWNAPVVLATPVAVVIENESEARPQQTGLAEADVVYEAMAEGGITRFLAIFKNKTPVEFGPVRSARPYFVDWAEEYGGAFVHVGGSPESLEKLYASKTLLNINETLDFPTIYRNKNYPAPHNAFTTLELILDEIKRLNFKTSAKTPAFVFKKPEHSSGNIRTIALDFSTSTYGVKYIYNSDKNDYERVLAGKPHHDIRPSNVIVQFTEQYVMDEKLRVNIQTVGTGKALIFRNGEVIQGTWQKEEGGATQFLDAQGNAVELIPGKTWIEVVGKEMGVNYF